MKRILILSVLLSAAMTAVQAQGLKFGFKGGLDVTEMRFNKSVFDTSNKTGWFFGPTAQVSLPVSGLGVDISAFYDQKKSEVNDETITQKNILIPLNLRWKLGLGSQAGIYLAAGPQFGFNVGDDEFEWTDRASRRNTFQLKKSSFSVNLGAGVYLSKHLEIGFCYNIAMGSTADATFSEAIDSTIKTDDAKPKSWQISAANFF